MAACYSEPFEIRCAGCGTTFTSDVWLIVHGGERPDLIEKARSGKLYGHLCPTCGALIEFDAPLLLFRPGHSHPLIFCPSERTTEEDDQRLAMLLLAQLQESLGPDWSEAWLDRLAAVPRAALADVLSGRLPASSQPSGKGIDPALRQTASKLLEAPTWEDLRAVLEAHPELMCLEVIDLFKGCHQGALDRGEGDAARIFGELCHLVSRSMIQGVAGAWLERKLSKALGVASEDLAPEVHMALMLIGAADLDLASPHDVERLQREFPALADVLARAHALSVAPGPELEPLLQQALQAEHRAANEHSPRALEDAVDAWERARASPALQTAPPHVRLKVQDGASHALLLRSQTTGTAADLQRAMQLLRDSLSKTYADSPLRLWRLNNLGVALRARYRRFGEREDLDEAIWTSRAVSLLVEPDSPSRPGYLNNLATSLQMLYELTNNQEDLDRALGALREATRLYPRDSRDLPAALTNLGLALSTRFKRTGQLNDLEEAVDCCAQAVAATFPDAPEFASRLDNHAGCLSQRHEVSGGQEDLDLSITLRQRALSLTPEPSPLRATQLNNLGTSLLRRYQRTGASEDLDQAIQMLQSAISLTDETAPATPLWLNNLAITLRTRYGQKGCLEDLDAAIMTSRRALVLAANQPATRLWIASGLGLALRQRHERTLASDDLDQAIALLEEVVSDVSTELGTRKAGLMYLGTCLSDRYKRTKSSTDLDRAIEMLEGAAKLAPAGAQDLGAIQNNLAEALLIRHRRSGDAEDLDRATRAVTLAVEGSPPAGLMLPLYLGSLGDCWRLHHERSGKAAHLDAALEALERASHLGIDRNPEVTLNASRVWCRLALQQKDWAQATRAAGYGLEAAERLHTGQLLRADQESWLRAAHHLPAMAAYAQARQGDLRGAALTLERGRARLMSDALDRDRADLEALRGSHPEAARRFQGAWSRLQHLERHATPPGGRPEQDETWSRDQIRAARSALEAVIVEIRQLPGHEVFLSAPTWRDLEHALEPGVPAVYMVSTVVGGLVLILLKQVDRVRIVDHWANALTEDRLSELYVGAGVDAEDGWFRLQLEARNRAHLQDEDEDEETAAARREAAATARRRWHETIQQTARALWDLVMGGVVDRLEALGAKEAVLLPGGMLGMLPLHAAWTDSPARRFALDRVAFSLAPSLRGLAHARRRRKHVEPWGLHLLAVCDPEPARADGAQPAPPGGHPSDLPFSRLEVEAISTLFDRSVTLMGAQATRAAVLARLPTAQVAHFSCHGGMDWFDPYQSGLLMTHDEVLTVQDILHQHLPDAQLAVLSACETGLPGFELPDEVVAMPSALLNAGFAGVVASLWSVSDLATALLIARFYELWIQDRLRPAVALQRAQLWIRDTTVADMEAHFDQQIPTFAGLRRPGGAAEVILPTLSVLARRDTSKTRVFAHPYWWAAFTFSGG